MSRGISQPTARPRTPEDEFVVEFAFNLERDEISIYTVGLYLLDLPELFVVTDRAGVAGPGDTADMGGWAMLIGQGLVELGRQMKEAGDPIGVTPVRLGYEGRAAQFSLEPETLPRGVIRTLIALDADFVCEVKVEDCTT